MPAAGPFTAAMIGWGMAPASYPMNFAPASASARIVPVRGSYRTLTWHAFEPQAAFVVGNAPAQPNVVWINDGAGTFSEGAFFSEADNNKDNTDLTPRTSPLLANLTLVGGPVGDQRVFQ